MLPLPFINQIKELLPSEWPALEAAIQGESPIGIRMNNKATAHLPYDKVPWCASGYYLPVRPLFTADPLFHAGVYYVQEAASMFLEQVIGQHIHRPVNALDLCAAPGGKATHLSNLLPAGSFLIANETIRTRAAILAENMLKWGNADVAVTNNSAADFGKIPAIFDLITADVPCSGEGMFRKDPGAIDEWSPANVQLCAARQRSIIGDVWPALKEGGIMVYSTCTYNRMEDEENVAWIKAELGAQSIPVCIDATWGIIEHEYCYRFYPHKTRSEGFFIAVLRKTAPSSLQKSSKMRNDKQKQIVIKPEPFLPLLQKRNWQFQRNGNGIYAFDKRFEEIIALINRNLHPLFIGIPLGEEKGNDFIPHPALALSKHLDTNYFSTTEIAFEIAIAYLKREAILLNDKPKGYILLTYKNIPLGWVKNLGTRANNLYPAEWRIRMNIESVDSLKIFEIIKSL